MIPGGDDTAGEEENMVIEENGSEEGGRLFAIRRGMARPRFLVAARKERCARCGQQTRIVSIWGTPRGMMERIAWCRYCFEAECGVMRPSAGEREELERTLRAVEQQTPVTWFDSARPAADELERRGIL
jgi:hypothetical protein